jgi:hypothetical protein
MPTEPTVVVRLLLGRDARTAIGISCLVVSTLFCLVYFDCAMRPPRYGLQQRPIGWMVVSKIARGLFSEFYQSRRDKSQEIPTYGFRTSANLYSSVLDNLGHFPNPGPGLQHIIVRPT